jgi:hypothetical protein
MQGRAFGNLYGAVGLAAGLSYVFGGLLLDAIGPRAVLAIAGGGGVAVAAVTWLAMPAGLRDARGVGALTLSPNAQGLGDDSEIDAASTT